MNLKELHIQLRTPFTKERGYGATKIKSVGFENIYFVVPPAPPEKIDGQLPAKLLSVALKVIGGLPSIDKATPLDKLIHYLFVRQEVVCSSRLEGTWSTIDHALTPGEICDKNEGKNQHQAVRCYANILEEMIEVAKQKKEKIFNEDFICKIHKKIVENDPFATGIPGSLRTEGKSGSIVIIGGGLRRENSIYNPAPPSQVKRCLREVLDWLGDEKLAQLGDASVGGPSLPIRMAIGHVHFEAVHPFTDGNGRTGRMLWPLQMVCSGYMPLYLSGYVEKYKDDYRKSLESAQKKLNYIPMIEFICNAIIETDQENRETRKAIIELERKWQEISKFRDNSAPRRALKLMLTNPIICSSFLEKELGISKTASVDAINALKRKKIIRFRELENRKRIYAAEELIAILSRPYGSDIDLALERAQRLLQAR
ncbi:MAG: hypothetical protein A2381_11110 [Bdellovibrionales bacterium RIFOXYB1_FULL_37_110]|nr:MAG: hypothetical protein A2181_01430 [Bdellovibrionales bacterium RIFOXYA1_FULL_38_20]OFZ48589.1 MAG: hypothetical protein A2417_09595 [Bdellovibrionales bacterium RIFOXYC1_FULL_37_79]OFZ58398.1 MAG: hypothetical protein A2381_11110 [Bdellovibrionales bacterium RIFOXYB1_FULL_37_110]OFZ62513.1 MAG: hypothetical protein A2577_01220 [Bdellovibrionales bacterium RIFOXYD1_FULL_36_51]